MSKENNLFDIRLDYQKDLISNFEMSLEDILNKLDNDDEFYNDVKEYTSDYFVDYEIYNYQLFELAGQLYLQGYNILEKAIEWNADNPIIVNSVLEEYVWDDFVVERNIIAKKEEPVR
ncbi:hypothetical protein [Spiroplasma sp. DGKH1]|uniref:hypothetical protein n=1 Tax=Spiroplasma sp. DGKH1 TaxID=3050074 RepID=UPI0034C65109